MLKFRTHTKIAIRSPSPKRETVIDRDLQVPYRCYVHITEYLPHFRRMELLLTLKGSAYRPLAETLV